MSESRTLGDLYKTKDLTEDALAAAVSGYVADPAPGPREIAPGITLDVAAAVAASTWATEVLGREDATEPQKRAAVRTAMLLARVNSSVATGSPSKTPAPSLRLVRSSNAEVCHPQSSTISAAT